MDLPTDQLAVFDGAANDRALCEVQFEIGVPRRRPRGQEKDLPAGFLKSPLSMA